MAAEFDDIAAALGAAAKRRASSPFDLLQMIERGLPTSALEHVASLIAPDDRSFRYRIVPRPTLARRHGRGARLTAHESEQVVRLAGIWSLALDVWQEPEDARAFLFRPHPMLEGRKPIDVVLGGDFGARLVEGILGRLKYGSAA